MKCLFTQHQNIYFDTDKNELVGITFEQLCSWMKSKFSTVELYKKTVFNSYNKILGFISDPQHFAYDPNHKLFEDLLNKIADAYPTFKPLTYEDAFKVESEELRQFIFDSLSIEEMVKNLKTVDLATESKETIEYVYDENGELLRTKTGKIKTKKVKSVYTTCKMDGKKLGLPEREANIYAVRCTCPSKNTTHWIWVDEQYKEKPLEAIASTFHLHKSVIDKAVALKRQGDIMIVELSEPVEIQETDEIVPLTAEQYFRLLKAQS